MLILSVILFLATKQVDYTTTFLQDTRSLCFYVEDRLKTVLLATYWFRLLSKSSSIQIKKIESETKSRYFDKRAII